MENFQHGHDMTRFGDFLFLNFNFWFFGLEILLFVSFGLCPKCAGWTKLRDILWEEDRLSAIKHNGKWWQRAKLRHTN